MPDQVITLSNSDQLREAMAVNEAIHGNPSTVWEDFLLRHPHWGAQGVHRAVTVDDRIVALTSLPVWQQRFGSATLPTGEIGLVGTLADHRNRGYSRALMESWLETMRRESIPVSFLIGIPGFYERWDYQYAAPDYVSALLSVAVDALDLCAEASGTVRDADPDGDVAGIVALVDQESRHTPASPVLDGNLIRYFIERSDVHGVAWRIVEDPTGRIAGVVRMKRWGEGIGPQAQGAVTLVAARDDQARASVAAILLDHLRQANQPELPLCIAPHGPFARWLYQRGAKRTSDQSVYPGGYATMYRINDLATVLDALRGSWDTDRIVGQHAGASITIRVGRDEAQVATIAVTARGAEVMPGDGGIMIDAPPAVTVPWVTGWRSAADWLDGTSFPSLPGPSFDPGNAARVPPEARSLLRKLFPARHPYIGDTIQNA